MKKRNISRFSILLPVLCLIILGSCSKVLEQTPKNATYYDAFWKTSRDFRAAMAGNYSLVRAAFSGPDAGDSWSFNNGKIYYYMYGDAMAKNYFTIQYQGDRGGADGLEAIQNGDFTGTYNYQSLGDWTKHYKSIAMANLMIDRVENTPAETFDGDEDDPEKFRRSMMGQAYFLRALTYFAITRVWGDVPIVTEAYEDPLSAPQLPRSPKQEVYDLIEADAKKAAELLEWGFTNVSDRAVTANRGSAYALLAHFYLWRATMKNVANDAPDMQDVNSADTAIDRIMAYGGYTLTDTSNYYQTFIGQSTEGIFELAMNEDNLEGSSGHIGMAFLRGDNVAQFGSNPRFHVSTSYLTRHYLVKGEFIPAHWFWDGTQWVWIPDQNNAIMDSTDVRYRRNFSYTTQARPSCIKYSNVNYRSPNLREPYLSNNMIIFRLADMMLLKAEIALYKNNPDAAIDIINGFRIRNGAYVAQDPNDPNDVDRILEHGMSVDEVMTEYIIERGKELFLEGHIFYDLLRTRKYSEFIDWMPDDVRFKREGFYLPVDPYLFRQNPYLSQTPYWLGKV